MLNVDIKVESRLLRKNGEIKYFKALRKIKTKYTL